MKDAQEERFTVEEYLAIEVAEDTKYEYHDGKIVPFGLVGVSFGNRKDHDRIVGNVFGEISQMLHDSGDSYSIFNKEVKLWVEKTNSLLDPDAMVVCNPLETSDKLADAVTNPMVIVEVLSPSSASYDRGDKFHFYRQIPSLKMYILIEQDKQQVDIYTKKGDLWRITRVEQPDEYLDISVLDIKIPLAELYRDVVLS